jgi:hypothetical protein
VTWRKQVEDGDIEARAPMADHRVDTKGDPRRAGRSRRAGRRSGPAGKADGNEVAVQELVLTHEGYERKQ